MIQGKYGKCIANHTARIFDRGAERSVGPLLDLSFVQYERDRDDTTEGTVRLLGRACAEQLDFIAGLRTHRHELVLFRGQTRVWEGPLHRITSRAKWAELVAKDVSSYLFGQPLTQEYNNKNPNVDTVTGRIEKIIEYELANGRTMFFPDTIENAADEVATWVSQGGTATAVADGWNVHVPAFESTTIADLPPINVLQYLDVHHFANEASTSMVTVPYQTTVGQHLDALSQDNGIDWTTVGRTIHIWDTSRANGTIPTTLTEADFDTDVIVTEYGADHTQAAYSVGQDGAYGAALSLQNLAYYGGWTQIHTVYQEEGTVDPTQGELDSQARRNLSGRTPAPVEVRVPDNSRVFLSDNLRIEWLVPGAQVPLRATLNARTLSQMQKVDYVRVIEDAKGERVTLSLMPATKPDDDGVEVP